MGLVDYLTVLLAPERITNPFPEAGSRGIKTKSRLTAVTAFAGLERHFGPPSQRFRDMHRDIARCANIYIGSVCSVLEPTQDAFFHYLKCTRFEDSSRQNHQITGVIRWDDADLVTTPD